MSVVYWSDTKLGEREKKRERGKEEKECSRVRNTRGEENENVWECG